MLKVFSFVVFSMMLEYVVGSQDLKPQIFTWEFLFHILFHMVFYISPYHICFFHMVFHVIVIFTYFIT